MSVPIPITFVQFFHQITIKSITAMKKTLLFSLTLIGLLLTSCGTTYMATYDVALAKVESPADVKKNFGETKVVLVKENNMNKYRYEDDYIDITWYVGTKNLYFTLKNKSGHSIKINWDDISFVDINGTVGRVMHNGVKYIDRNNSQPATTIPNGAKIDDVLIPTENVYYISPTRYTSGGWNERNLIPSYYKSKEAMDAEANSYVGKTMKVLMPISVEGVQNDYTFEFEISHLLTNTK